MNHKTVVILGQRGYVASNLALSLKKQGIAWRMISTYEIINSSRSQLENKLYKFDYVIWALGPGKKNIINIYDTSIFDKCFDLFLNYKAKHVFLSSADLYEFDNERKIKENKIRIPDTEYGLFKFILEKKAKVFLNDLCILRLPGIWGNEDKSSLISKIISKSNRNKKVYLNVNCKTQRDFIHIQDLTQAILLVLNKFNNDSYNLTSDFPISFGDLSNKLKLTFGFELELSKTENRKDLVLDITKFKKEYNYKTCVNFNDELKNYHKKSHSES